jgi:hypothetical protein
MMIQLGQGIRNSPGSIAEALPNRHNETTGSPSPRWALDRAAAARRAGSGFYSRVSFLRRYSKSLYRKDVGELRP